MTLVDQDHTGSKSWKLIARTISPTPSLFVARKPSTYSQGNMEEFLGEYIGGVGIEKWHAGAQSSNISETCKIRGNVTMEGL